MIPPATPAIDLPSIHQEIDECLQGLRRAAPTAIRLGKHLIFVRDHQLYEREDCPNLFRWADVHHGLKETQIKKYLKVGEELQPEDFDGRLISLDCMYQVALAPRGLRPCLSELGEEVKDHMVLQRCRAAGEDVLEQGGGVQTAIAAAREAAVVARREAQDPAARLAGSVNQIERWTDKLERQHNEGLEIDEVVIAEALARMQASSQKLTALQAALGRAKEVRILTSPVPEVPQAEVSILTPPVPALPQAEVRVLTPKDVLPTEWPELSAFLASWDPEAAKAGMDEETRETIDFFASSFQVGERNLAEREDPRWVTQDLLATDEVDLPKDSLLRAWAHDVLHRSLNEEGERDKALEHARSVLSICQRNPNVPPPWKARALGSVGNDDKDCLPAKALPCLQEALAIFDAGGGPLDGYHKRTLWDLAEALYLLNRREESEAIYKRVRAFQAEEELEDEDLEDEDGWEDKDDLEEAAAGA